MSKCGSKCGKYGSKCESNCGKCESKLENKRVIRLAVSAGRRVSRSQTVLMCSRVNIFWVGGSGCGWSALGQREAAFSWPAPSLEPPPWRRGGAPPWYLYTSPATGYMAARPFHSVCPQSCGFVYSKPEAEIEVEQERWFLTMCIGGAVVVLRLDKRLKRDHLLPAGFSTVAPQPWKANMFQFSPH